MAALGAGARSLYVPAVSGELQTVNASGLQLAVPPGAVVTPGEDGLDVSWCRAPDPKDPDCYFMFGPNRLAVKRLREAAADTERLAAGPVLENSRFALEPDGPSPELLPHRLANGVWLRAHTRSERGEKATDGFLEGTFELNGARYRVECYEGEANDKRDRTVDGSWCLPYLATIRPTG